MNAAVVKLPTAAPRKVVNNRYREQRQAARVLKERYAVHFDYTLPFEREKMAEVERMADYMLDNPMTAERAVIYAIVRALDEDTQLKVLATCCARGSDAARLAHLGCATPEQTYWIGRVIDSKLKGGEA